MPDFLETFDDTGKVAGTAWDDLSPFVQGYIQCLFFTGNASGESMVTWWDAETQEGLEEGTIDGNLPTDAGFSDLHPDTLAQIHLDCGAFEAKARHLLSQAYATGYEREQAGRDFWYDRNGHGVGFTDRKELEGGAWEANGSPRVGDPGWNEYVEARDQSIGRKLHAIAKGFRSVDCDFIGPDEESPTGYGFVHLS